MNKRKTTSIALAAAVAISTVQLAYPANVFAHENSSNLLTASKSNELSGDCSAEDGTSNVKWKLIQNNEDLDNPTYTLTISGRGAMKDEYRPYDDDNSRKKKITKIIIGNGITTIGQGAFWDCSGVEEIEFEKGSSLKEIKKNGFHSNINLKKIILPASLEIIGIAAFYNGANLNSVEFENPDNLKEIGGQGFGACKNLFYINNPNESKDWEWMPKNLTKIGANAFSGDTKICGKITVPANVTELGDRVFCNLSSISSLKFEENSKLKSIGVNVFENMTISELNLPESLLSIGNNAFINMKSLENIVIPSNVSSIGGTIFNGCDNLKSVVFESGSKLTELPKLSAKFSKIVLPDGLRVIKESALQDSQLEYVQLPSTVEEIEKLAIKGGLKLHSVDMTNIESEDLKIGDNALAEIGNTDIRNSIIYIKNKNHLEKVKESNNTKYSHSCYAVTNGGHFENNKIFEDDKLLAPKKEGCVFKGWHKTEDFSDNVITIPEATSNEERIVYYAAWLTPKEYTIEYGKTDKILVDDKDVTIIGNYKSEDESIVKVDNNGNLTPTGVGKTTVSYTVKFGEEEQIITSKVVVNAPEGTVAMIDKVPYTDLQDAIDSKTNEGKTIKVVGDIELTESLDLSRMIARTIDFGNHKITTASTFPEKETSLIKIEGNKEKITISNAKFDTSSKEGLDAIKVVGNENGTPSVTVNKVEVNNKGNNTGSAIYVENANLEITGNINVTGNENNKTAVEIQGDNSNVILDKNVSVNNDLTPEIGNDHSDAIIMGNTTESNDFVNENNIGGGNYYPSKPSKPVYTHKEVIGANRYETAAKVADELGSYDNVVLVNAESSMSDGLSASGLAGKENGAILLTKKDSIPKATMDRLKKVKKVYIIGGENAISQKVYNEITKNVPNVKIERLGGKTRVETSELVAKKLGNYNKAFVVNGFKGEADAMSASAVAAKNGAPILLTNGKTSTHAKKAGVEYYVIGGDTVVDKSIATKYDAKVLAGSDRYATNREVIDEFYSGSDKLYIANGDKLVDALTASPLAKNHGIVLVNKRSDKSILKDKNTVQVGGMDFNIDFE